MALGEFWKDYCTEKWNPHETNTFDSAYNSVPCSSTAFAVEEKIIGAPDSYKKFCDLIEKIANKL